MKKSESAASAVVEEQMEEAEAPTTQQKEEAKMTNFGQLCLKYKVGKAKMTIWPTFTCICLKHKRYWEVKITQILDNLPLV